MLTAPSDNVVPPLALIHLFGLGPDPLNFRSKRLTSGVVLLALQGHLFYKGCVPFFPLNSAPVVRLVVSTTATALSLFPRGSVTARKVGTSTGVAPWSLSAVTLRLSESLASFTLQWAFRGHVRLLRPSEGAKFSEYSYF